MTVNANKARSRTPPKAGARAAEAAKQSGRADKAGKGNKASKASASTAGKAWNKPSGKAQASTAAAKAKAPTPAQAAAAAREREIAESNNRALNDALSRMDPADWAKAFPNGTGKISFS